MSLEGIKWALEQAFQITGCKVDILLFDTCYMNMVEIIYQLGIGRWAPTFIIAPAYTPLQGLPYEIILATGYEPNTTPAVLVNKVLKSLNSHYVGKKVSWADVYALKPKSIWLRSIKKMISLIGSELAQKQVNMARIRNINLQILIGTLNKTPGKKAKLYAWCLKQCINKLIFPKMGGKHCPLSIYLPTIQEFYYTAQYYYPMKFTYRNRWLNYIAGKEVSLKPVKIAPYQQNLPLDGVINLINMQNPGLSAFQVSQIINKLGWGNCPKLEKN